MSYLANSDIVHIMQKTLNCVDRRLMDHGLRVAYMTYKIMRQQQKYTKQQLRDICLLALLHDIGAYKTEEIDKMLQFETADIWRHSLYGYLFLKNFSPLRQLSPAVCFHHANCSALACLHPSYRDLANTLSICDRADIFTQEGGHDINVLVDKLRKSSGKLFLPHIVDAFCAAHTHLNLGQDIIAADTEFCDILYGTPLSKEECYSYLRMIVLSIDFRSRQTAIHTIAVSHIASELAACARLNCVEREKIATAALMHDIGKTGVPLNILENPNRLTDEEMAVMKTHVSLSEKIIDGCVAEEIKRIAVRHHEKLDGSGYPYGVAAAELTVNERLMAVADILSALAAPRSYKEAFPKEKTIGILHKMAQSGATDADITALAVENYDYIVDELQRQSAPFISKYEEIHREYTALTERAQHIQSGKDCAMLIENACDYL